jgi:Ca-activated chloride channel family protein
MILRDSPHRGSASYGTVLDLASPSIGDDPYGYRREFLALVRKAQAISRR